MEQIPLVPLAGHGKQAILVGREDRTGNPHAVVPPDPDLHPCLRNRLTTDGVEDETLERSRSVANPHHQGQVAFPDPGKLHDVVGILEIRIRAGDQEIEARLDILRHGDELHLLVVIDRGRQVR